jgi:hypothetical protein
VSGGASTGGYYADGKLLAGQYSGGESAGDGDYGSGGSNGPTPSSQEQSSGKQLFPAFIADVVAACDRLSNGARRDRRAHRFCGAVCASVRQRPRADSPHSLQASSRRNPAKRARSTACRSSSTASRRYRTAKRPAARPRARDACCLRCPTDRLGQGGTRADPVQCQSRATTATTGIVTALASDTVPPHTHVSSLIIAFMF